MFINEITVINKLKDRDRFIAESYLNEYQNQASIANKSSSEDYKKYLTRTLNTRGFLFKNTDTINNLYKASFDELFSKEFKNFFLFDLQRDISGVYKDIKSVKKMSGIGMYDLFSSMFSTIPAKFLPSIELPEIDTSKIDLNEHEITQAAIKAIIETREDYVPPDINEFNYVKITDDDRELGPFDGMEYFTFNEETNQYDLIEDLTEFEEGTDYYIKDYIEYIPIEYTLDDLTSEEKELLKRQVLVDIIDNLFICYLKEFLITVKEIFSKYDLYTITCAVDVDADRYDKTVVKLLYSKLINVIAILAYATSASELISDPDISVTMKVINDQVKNCLSKSKTISDMLTTEPYFNSVLRYYFSNEFRNMLFHRIIIKSPISDSIEMTSSNVPVHKAYMVFSENLIILRNILDHLNLVETDVSTLFGAFLMSVVMFMQTVYMSAYISNYKMPIIKSVETIMRDFGFSFDSKIKADELLKFVPLY